jgi:hypothetical protein
MDSRAITSDYPNNLTIALPWWIRLHVWLRHRPQLAVAGFFVLLFFTHLPTDLAFFSADDYLQQAVLRGEAVLAEKGFEHTDPDQSWQDKIANTFHFFNAQQHTTAAQQQYGNLPWWSSTGATMQPFRPLSAATHWLDYQFWPDDLFLIQWHSLVYFYLFALAALLVYRRICPELPLALLATALLVFDISLSLNLGWLAARNSYLSCGLGMLALWLHMRSREDGCGWSLGLAPLVYGLALLAAEGGIASAAYLGAYALVLDKRGWWRGLLALLPYIVITLVWRYYYSALGFGASGLGLYVDPGRDLLRFVVQLFSVFPMICVSVLTGRDALLTAVDLPYVGFFVVVGWGLLGLFLWGIRSILRTDRHARFMLLGALFAVVPHSSLLSAGTRSGVFAAVGFFYILALVVARLARPASGRPQRMFASLIMGWHLLIPLALTIVVSWSLATVPHKDDGLNSLVSEHLSRHPDASVVIVNASATNLLYYLPYEWAVKDASLPGRIQALAPGLAGFTMTRTGDRRLELYSESGLVLHQNVPMSTEDQSLPFASKHYIVRMLSGLVTNPDEDFAMGRRFDRAGLQVTVLESQSNVVTRVRIDFADQEAWENKLWVAYDWKTGRYSPIAVPAQVPMQFAGPFH